MAQNVYTNCPTIAIGCFLYTNSSLTTPVIDGYYSNGTKYFFVSGGQVISEGLCNPPTTTTTTTTSTSTTSTSTTLPPSDNFIVGNSSTGGVTSDVTPSFYVITSGSFPVNSGDLLLGNHAGFSGIISISVTTAPSGGGSLSIEINSVQVECISVASAGTYTTTQTFGSGDTFGIFLTDESC
jgi:hypothetical protein